MHRILGVTVTAIAMVGIVHAEPFGELHAATAARSATRVISPYSLTSVVSTPQTVNAIEKWSLQYEPLASLNSAVSAWRASLGPWDRKRLVDADILGADSIGLGSPWTYYQECPYVGIADFGTYPYTFEWYKQGAKTPYQTGNPVFVDQSWGSGGYSYISLKAIDDNGDWRWAYKTVTFHSDSNPCYVE